MPETAAALISPASENLLDTYEVSTAVNRTANDNPELVERYAAPAQAEAAPQADTPRAKRKNEQRAGVAILMSAKAPCPD